MGRKRKDNVISLRLSDEELEGLHDIMKNRQITRVSDLMRQILAMVRVNLYTEVDNATSTEHVRIP